MIKNYRKENAFSNNRFFYVHFVADSSINYLQLDFNFEEKPNFYYHVIVTDDKDYYYNMDVNGDFTCKFKCDKFIKYNIKLIAFDANNTTIEIIDEKKWVINCHDLTIQLKSMNYEELRIWKEYLKEVADEYTFVRIIYGGIRFNVLENNTMFFDDSIEISRDVYNDYLINSHTPLTDDYSPLTIIKTLFDIL